MIMKSFLFLIYFIYSLFCINIKIVAQCTSCTADIAASNSAITANSGDVICVTSGTTQSGNIIVNAGGKVCFASGVTVTGGFTVNNMNSATSIIIQSGATISSSSSINFNGTATGGTIDNRGSWLLANLTLPAQTTFNNSGSFGTSASKINLNMNPTSNFINTGQVFINNFNFNAGATFTSNAGNVSIGSSGGSSSLDGTMNINGGGLAFEGSVNVNATATLTTQPSTTFSVAGALANNGNITLGSTNPTIGGSVTNNSGASITMNNSVLSVGGAFANNGTIAAAGECGRINVAGGSVQNASGSVGASADICDLSATAPNLFDSQAGTVSPLATRCTCSPTLLPVTWVYVKAKQTDSQITILWATIATSNHQKFEIERSTDTQSWVTIGEEQGINTAMLQTYSFIDATPPKSITYYRIKQVEVNGIANYSAIVAARMDETFGELLVMPNPFDEELAWYITKTSLATADIVVTLMSVDGKLLVEKNMQSVLIQQVQRLMMANIPKGTYLFRVASAEYWWEKKVTKN